MTTSDVSKLFLAIVAVLLCTVCPVHSQVPEVSADPILSSLQVRIGRAMADLRPKAQFEITGGDSGGSLTVRYQTRNYMIYPRTKSGRLGRELVEWEGPDDEGILLKIHLQTKGEINQAVVPQTIRNPYWSTYLNVYPIEESEKQIYIALSYRGHTDKALIQKIKEIAAGGAGQAAPGVELEPAGEDAEPHQDIDSKPSARGQS